MLTRYLIAPAFALSFGALSRTPLARRDASAAASPLAPVPRPAWPCALRAFS